MSKKATVIDILNILNLPEKYKNELLATQYMMLVSKIGEKYPLEKEEFIQAVNNKQDVLDLMVKKHPGCLEDEEMKKAIEGVNEKFIFVLDSLASKDQQAEIDKLLTE